MAQYDLPKIHAAPTNIPSTQSHTHHQMLAQHAPITAVSVIVPTRNEAGNIEPLVRRLEQALERYELEIIVVDDSDDDTPDVVRSLQATSRATLTLIHRPRGQRANGLGGAVVAGMRAATQAWMCVMDADLQHPPEVVPQLIERAEETNATLVVASRYTGDGSAEGLSSSTRTLVSHSAARAAWLAFPRRLRGVSDPMSGFFLVQRSMLDLDVLQPDGFKILLEVIVRTPNISIAEVGFRFGKRQAGESKASFREGMRYLAHLSTLRFPPSTVRAARFMLVGFSGLFVNLILLAIATEVFGLHYLVSALISTQGSTLWNFMLTELWVFGDRTKSSGRYGRLAMFLLMNNAALLLRGPILFVLTSLLGIYYLASNAISILLLTVIRYFTSDALIWGDKKKGKRVSGSYNYNIHGIITVTSTTWLPELERFLVDQTIENPTIRVRIGLIGRTGGMFTGQAITEKRRLRYNEGLGALGFGIDVTLGDTIEVVASPLLRFSPHVLYTNVVEPILRWTFVERGYALVHGACIAFDGHAFLVTARTDTGKTTTILRILDEQNKGSERGTFLSDDLTLVSPDGKVLTYPKPLTISAHTVAAIHTPRLSRRERLGLPLQSRLHSRDGRRFAMWLAQHKLPVATINTVTQLVVPPPKYHVQQLVPHVNLAQAAQLRGMIVIERGGEGSVQLSNAEGLEILLQNCDDAYGFPPYNTIRSFLHGATDNDLVSMEQRIIGTALEKLPATLLRSTKMDWSFRIPALADAVIAVSIAAEAAEQESTSTEETLQDAQLQERELGGADLAMGYGAS